MSNKKIRITTVLAFIALGFVGFSNESHAQTTSFWSSCPNSSEEIVRCQTINCPKGDTNKDGRCSLQDEGAQTTEARNDAFCANPPSNCGEVLYFAKGKTESCVSRIKESGANCKLYKAGNPSFTPSPTPTPSVKPSSTPTPSSTSKPRLNVSPMPTQRGTALPKTGLPLWLGIIFATVGMIGIHVYEREKEKGRRS